jgi:hypothetical protein
MTTQAPLEDVEDYTEDSQVRAWSRLCKAMYDVAVYDLKRGPRLKPGVHLTASVLARLEAIDWIYSDSPTNVFRFENVCMILSRDADLARKTLAMFLTDKEKDVWL